MLIGAACEQKTVVASTCQDGTCPPLPECTGSIQQYPEQCRGGDAGVCHGVEVPPDTQVCEDCYDMLDRLKIGSPLGPCGCTYCGLQLKACFESAQTEPDGSSQRDRRCRAIVECAWSVGCEGSDCYCGKGVNRDTCLKNANEGKPLGPCATVIQNAAGCSQDPLPGACVFGLQLMKDSVLERATEVAKCVSGDPHLQGDVIRPMCD